MSFSAHIPLYIFAGLYGFLLIVAFIHVVQGMRFGAGTRLIVSSTVLFILGILIVTTMVFAVLRPVDWRGTLTLELPSFSSNTLPQ